MKTSLRVFGILLIGLFAISMVGCERTEDPPPPPTTPVKQPPPLSHEEKLAGEYELTRIEYSEDGEVEVYETPDVEGTLILIHEGSIYLSFSDVEGHEESARSDAWSATATNITVEGDPASYTLRGTTLTLIIEEPESDWTVTMKWKKKKQ